jgi:exodeoxyribonuclease VII large subunit
VQGVAAVAAIVDALADLNAQPEVDVIVIARGGGSVEDLLPFSNERLIRAVVASRAPVVTAIGHEQDVPLVDLVADLRASTPTDAAKRIVPDVAEETQGIAQGRARARRAVERRIVTDAHEVARLRSAGRRNLRRRIDHGLVDIGHLRARLVALSPAATLDRGYAVLRTQSGAVVRDPRDVVAGDRLDARVAGGSFTVGVEESS